MLPHLIQFAICAGIIIVAGIFLTQATDRLAEHLGIGRSAAGMFLLAIATSLPELAIGCNSALKGVPDFTVGDVLGSSLMNLLLLALLDLTHYSRGHMFSKAAAANAMTAGVSIVMTAIVLLFILIRPTASIFGRIGFGSVALLAAYGLSMRLILSQQRFLRRMQAPQVEEMKEEMLEGHSLRYDAVIYAVCALVILATARYLLEAAEGIATVSGLGATFVGTTLIALSTSLPEVVTTLSAVRMKAYDLAVGNIFGSNVFNMLILVAVDFFYVNPLYASVQPHHAITAGWVILVTMVAVLGLLYQEEKRYWVIEPDAALVILLVIAALVSVYFAGAGIVG